MNKVITFLNSSFVNNIINLIKKFSFSKSYWSLSYLVLLFTFREAFSWKWGRKIEYFVEEKLLVEVSKYEELFWESIEFIFSSGSIELVILGTFIFFLLSFIKISESNSTQINIKLRGDSLVKILAVLGVIGILLIVLNYLDDAQKRISELHQQEKKELQIKLVKLEGIQIKFMKIKMDYAILEYKYNETPKARKVYSD